MIHYCGTKKGVAPQAGPAHGDGSRRKVEWDQSATHPYDSGQGVMELQFAFLADAATVTNDGLFAVIGGGLDVIEAQSFPAIKSTLVLVGRVLFKPSEFGKTHVVHCEIHGPSGKIPQPDMSLEIKPFKHPRDPRR